MEASHIAKQKRLVFWTMCSPLFLGLFCDPYLHETGLEGGDGKVVLQEWCEVMSRPSPGQVRLR